MAFGSDSDDQLLLPGWEQLVYFVAKYSILELHEKKKFILCTYIVLLEIAQTFWFQRKEAK